MFRTYVALILGAEVIFLASLPFVAPGMPFLVFTPVVPLTLLVAFVLYSRRDGISHRLRNISPEQIARYRPRRESDDYPATVEDLSHLIAERATEIHRTLGESPSEVQIEMCALGYHACVNDMITLTHLANEELRDAGLLRRFALRRARKRATDALTSAREAFPPSALRATRQEQQ